MGLIFLGFSLPYCLSSPLLGFFADKYPVSLKWGCKLCYCSACDELPAYQGRLGLQIFWMKQWLHCYPNTIVTDFYWSSFQTTRRWFMILGGLLSGLSFFILGPAPVLHITRCAECIIKWLWVVEPSSLGKSSDFCPVFLMVASCGCWSSCCAGLALVWAWVWCLVYQRSSPQPSELIPSYLPYSPSLCRV